MDSSRVGAGGAAYRCCRGRHRPAAGRPGARLGAPENRAGQGTTVESGPSAARRCHAVCGANPFRWDPAEADGAPILAALARRAPKAREVTGAGDSYSDLPLSLKRPKFSPEAGSYEERPALMHATDLLDPAGTWSRASVEHVSGLFAAGEL